MEIIKSSGEKQKFSREKLYGSLKRAGAKPELAQEISQKIAKTIHPGISSEKILEEVSYCLQKENPMLAARYNLKRAIMELGPTGFPFESYIAEILKEYGYDTKVGRRVQGYCVNHEVDVIAQKGKKHFMIECKYHNRGGSRSDVKVALYTFARFLDVKKACPPKFCEAKLRRAWEEIPGHKHFFHQAWLVTNTKCTTEAIRYARCVGLKIISWRYPKDESLEYLIEKKGLYPVTILPSLNRYAKERLAEKQLMLAKDLLKYSVEDLVSFTGLQQNIVKKLQTQVKELCLC